MTISMIGLGKLGASMAAAIASRGFHVIGCDRNPRVVANFAAGQAPVVEPQLQETMTAHRDRLGATGDIAEAVRDSSLTFIVVPTPTDDTGGFSIEHVRNACREIGRALATKRERHHIVLSSTVLPGSSRFGLIPEIERASGKACGTGFYFTYSPEFIALGSVIRDFLNPDLTLIGEVDTAAGTELEEFYRRLLPKPTPCRRMSLENAELAKIALNAYVTTKIAFANMIADLCERLPGGDARAVCDALGADVRIGRRYLNGGPSFGGPCFPRDNRALTVFAEHLGVPAALPECTEASNDALHERIAQSILARTPAGATVAVLGLAYKPDTTVVECSPGIELCRRLTAAGRPVRAFDPLANDTARAALPPTVHVAATVTECLRPARVAVVTTPDPFFRTLEPQLWAETGEKRVVFDLWAALPETVAALPGVELVQRGKGVAAPELVQILRGRWA